MTKGWYYCSSGSSSFECECTVDACIIVIGVRCTVLCRHSEQFAPLPDASATAQSCSEFGTDATLCDKGGEEDDEYLMHGWQSRPYS